MNRLYILVIMFGFAGSMHAGTSANLSYLVDSIKKIDNKDLGFASVDAGLLRDVRHAVNAVSEEVTQNADKDKDLLTPLTTIDNALKVITATLNRRLPVEANKVSELRRSAENALHNLDAAAKKLKSTTFILPKKRNAREVLLAEITDLRKLAKKYVENMTLIESMMKNENLFINAYEEYVRALSLQATSIRDPKVYKNLEESMLKYFSEYSKALENADKNNPNVVKLINNVNNLVNAQKILYQMKRQDKIMTSEESRQIGKQMLGDSDKKLSSTRTKLSQFVNERLATIFPRIIASNQQWKNMINRSHIGVII